MSFKLSSRSEGRLEGINPQLIEVVKTAITLTKVDFGVTCGMRTVEEQEKLVASGASQTMKSKHLEGRAVDLVAYIGPNVTWSLNKYDEIADVDGKIIVATYGVAAVGINIPRIFNLVLLEPGKSFVRVIQSIGRGIRKAEDKDFVQVWDITSTCKFAKRHLTARKKFYKEANYPFQVEKVDWEAK